MRIKLNITAWVIMMLIGVLFFMFVMPLVKADLGTFQSGNCINIKTILNSSYVNISTINYPNSTLIISNQAMTKNGYSFNYTFCNTVTIGTYTYDYFDDAGNVYVNNFEVTSTGNNTSLSNSLFYIGMIVLLLVFSGFFIFCFMRFDNMAIRVLMGGLLYLMIVGLFSIAHVISFDFMGNTFITQMLNIIWMVTMYASILVFPALLIFYLYTIYQIKEIQGLMDKGIGEEEAQHRVKNRRKHN